MKLNAIFSQYPTQTFDFYKNVKSATGKTSTPTLTISDLKVFLQHEAGIDPILTLGQNAYCWVDVDLLASTKIEPADKLKNATYTAEVITSDLHDSSPSIDPFYELTLKLTYL